VCANENIVLHCGQTRCRVFDWFYFSLFCELNLQLNDRLLFKSLDPDLIIDGFRGWLGLVFMSLYGFRGSKLSGKGPEATFCFSEPIWSQLSSDLSTLFGYSRSQTTDPRDRVYAMLRFTAGFMQLGLKPNYRISTEEVFTRTTVEILIAAQSWSAKQFIYPSASPFLPSWAIDFTLPTVDTECFLDRIGDDINAAPSTRSNVAELGPGIIISAGFVYDEIVAVTPIYSPLDLKLSFADGDSDITWIFWKWWNTLTNSDNPRSVSRRENGLWASYCRTLCLDSEDFCRKDVASCHPCKLDSDPVKRRLPIGLWLLLKSSTFRSARLVVTRTGQIGLAPLAVEPGDYIAILAGGDVPFTLRKVRMEGIYRDAYKLLGCCYIDGQPPNYMST
jgi:hypothetical protein